MTKIIDLNEHRRKAFDDFAKKTVAETPHHVGELICLKCLKRHCAVWAVGTALKDLECSCGETGFLICTGQNINEAGTDYV